MQSDPKQRRPHSRLLINAGVLLGLGLGVFFDGIVLHQILQWHHMLTSAGYPATTVAGIKLNTFADGLFHAGTYVLTVAGLFFLWRSGRVGNVPWSYKTFVGSLLIGAGSFNLVEGIINHHILGIHHVKSGPNELAWDLGFLAIGAILVVIGWLLLRTQKPAN